MKKASVFLVLVVLLALVIAGFGYVPFRIKDSDRYVLYSRTSGWEAVDPGTHRFDWRWELLIPRNVEIYRFPDLEQTIRITSTRSLPSADLYARFLAGEPEFSTSIDLDLVIAVRDEYLGELAADGLRPQTLETWFDRFDARISLAVLTITEQEIDRFSRNVSDSRFYEQYESALVTRLEERFPEIRVKTVIPRSITVPDLALYQLGRETYQTVQTVRREALVSATVAQANEEAADQRNMELLDQYGQILTEYPVLLDYLSIVAESGGDPLNITVPLQ